MSSHQSEERFDFVEGEKRPFVTKFAKKPKFSVGDKVYLLQTDGAREGPYLIIAISSAGKYTLGLENGEAVKNREEFSVHALEAE